MYYLKKMKKKLSVEKSYKNYLRKKNLRKKLQEMLSSRGLLKGSICLAYLKEEWLGYRYFYWERVAGIKGFLGKGLTRGGA